jgi:hypothetical protein
MSAFDDAFNITGIDDPIEHVREAVHINGGQLREALERLPGDLAHYGFRFAAAHRKMLSAKMRLDEHKGLAYLECRETLEDLGRKITEAGLEAMIVATPHVREARADLIEAEF